MVKLMEPTNERLPALESEGDTLLWKIPLWDVINAYVRACGGDVGTETVGGARMDAVVRVEKALAVAREHAIDLYIEGKAKTPQPPDWICSSCGTPKRCPNCDGDDINLDDGSCNECSFDISDAWFTAMRELGGERESLPTAPLPHGWRWENQDIPGHFSCGARGPQGEWVDADTIEGVSPINEDRYNEARRAQAIVRSVTPFEIDRVNPGPVPDKGR
jgi:hypothetical protein